jgi:hypothetical protein
MASEGGVIGVFLPKHRFENPKAARRKENNDRDNMPAKRC